MTSALPDRIDAAPTKAFFIEMLVKDIKLAPAIIDLLDNSVDGARRLRGNGGSFEGLWVRVIARPEYFEIEDNCGGISLDIAKNYAFRFGRPKGFPTVEGSVGQFGVGMKRALFKLGRHFEVSSITAEHKFVVDVDVNEWQENDDDWHFDWTSLEEVAGPLPEDEMGTTIRVSDLRSNVSEDFRLTAFIDSLAREISENHQIPMENGLSISLNGVPVDFDMGKLLVSEDMRPANSAFELNPKPGSSVHVRIVAGLGKSSPREAGWYVFCNGRQVVGADRSSLTGWDGRGGVTIPRFHNQFARFRGYVFFDADDAALLPWNTTKTGVDEDADVYRSVKNRMVQVMRPVIDFLNRLDQEKDLVGEEDIGPLEEALSDASEKATAQLVESESFKPPRPVIVERKPKTQRIQYDRPVDLIKRVKVELAVSTLKAVGEKTFDYFVEMEELDE